MVGRERTVQSAGAPFSIGSRVGPGCQSLFRPGPYRIGHNGTVSTASDRPDRADPVDPYDPYDPYDRGEPQSAGEPEATIRLGKFLKWANLVDSGSEARDLVQGGYVRVDGEVETRRGRQLRQGQEVTLAWPGEPEVTVVVEEL